MLDSPASVVGNQYSVHTVPFQFTALVPLTAHTVLGPLPQMPFNAFAELLGKEVQPVPSQCRILPVNSPSTAHTSLGPLPQMPASVSVVPLVDGDHALPSQCMIVPTP